MTTFMTPEDLHSIQVQLGALASLVPDMPLGAFIQHWEHFHSVGPILAPTTYRSKMGHAEDWLELARALLPFQRAARAALEKKKAAQEAGHG